MFDKLVIPIELYRKFMDTSQYNFKSTIIGTCSDCNHYLKQHIHSIHYPDDLDEKIIIFKECLECNCKDISNKD